MKLITSIEPLETRIAPAFAAVIPLASLDGTNGFKLSGVADGDGAGRSVSDAGDVNGDGFDDLIIGAATSEGANGVNTRGWATWSLARRAAMARAWRSPGWTLAAASSSPASRAAT